MRIRIRIVAIILILCCAVCLGQDVLTQRRPRVRDIGLKIGILPTGPLNAITDVAGVEVGQTTLIKGDNIRTGVTVVLPHGGNLFQEKVPGAVFIGNAFGKLLGSTQVNELGEIETPIVLTSTLSVPRVADAVIDYMLALPGNEDVISINPLVGETNDSYLNDIRGRHIDQSDVFAAIHKARSGPVEEGAVGAGTGTVAFGFKGGIGTSSRRLPQSLGGYTVGVLVQSNFGGVLTIAGAPVGQELGRYYFKEELEHPEGATPTSKDWSVHQIPDLRAQVVAGRPLERTGPLLDDLGNGSIMIVIATDAPVDYRNLRRMAARTMMGLARTGSSGSTGSGDYAIAFSSHPRLRIRSEDRLHPDKNSSDKYSPREMELLTNDAMSPLFLAVIEATEEAVYNSLFQARSMTGQGRIVEELPIERTVSILRKYGALGQSK